MYNDRVILTTDDTDACPLAGGWRIAMRIDQNGKIEIGRKRRSHEPGANRDSATMTMRALVDVGESIAHSVHAIYSPIRLYLCVAMEVKPDALARQQEADRKTAAGMFKVDPLWSAATVNARWARDAILIDGDGNELYAATSGARGMTDAGAKEVFFEYNAMESYPEKMYLVSNGIRVRVK